MCHMKNSWRHLVGPTTIIVWLAMKIVQCEILCGQENLVTGSYPHAQAGDCTLSLNNKYLGVTDAFVPGGLYNVTLSCRIDRGNIAAISVRILPQEDSSSTLHPGYSEMCTRDKESGSEGSGLHFPFIFNWRAPSHNPSAQCLNFSFVFVDDSHQRYRYLRDVCQDTVCKEFHSAESGIVTSKGFPRRYDDNLNCTYFITPESGKTVYMQFQEFDIEASYDGKCFDALRIHGSTSAEDDLCGKVLACNLSTLFFASLDDFLRINFNSDLKIGARGFKAFYYTLSQSDCNKTLNTPNGTISSINYPTDYFPQVNCITTIEVPENYTIKFQLDFLDIPGESDCSQDFVEVWSSARPYGNENRWRRCGSFSEYHNDKLLFESSGTTMQILFHSDHSGEGKGFKATYEAVESCANGSQSAFNGTLVSQNFPANYPNNQNCYSVITLNQSMNVIELKFDMLNTESFDGKSQSDEKCDSDYVEIHDGEKLHRRCGDWQGREHKLYFRSVGRTLVFRFVSNKKITAPGFEASWRAILNDTSLIPCPDAWEDDGDYCFQFNDNIKTWFESNQACVTEGGQLATVKNRQTHLFIQTNIKSRLNASDTETFWIGANDLLFENDFYWVDGTRVQNPYWFPGWEQFDYDVRQPSDDGLANEDCVELRRTFCLPNKGQDQIEDFLWNDRHCNAKNGYICQKYKSEGDRLETYEPPACNRTIHLSLETPSGRISSPGYPANYTDFLECVYAIRAKPGYRIEVEFDSFQLEETIDCGFDYVQVSTSPPSPTRDTDTRYCGNKNKTIKLLRHISPYNELYLTFHTDHNVVSRGFSLTVHLVEASKSCGNGSWIGSGFGCLALYVTTAVDQAEASSMCQSMEAELLKAASVAEQLYVFHQLLPGRADIEIWKDKPLSMTSGGLCEALSVSGDRVSEEYQSIFTVVQKPCSSKLGFICKRSQESTVWFQETKTGDINGEWATSNDSDGDYENNMMRILRIDLPQNFRIFINVSFLDIEFQEDCLYDYLEIQEISETTRNKTYCGISENAHYVSKGNVVKLTFHSDYSVRRKGFHLAWRGYNMSHCNKTYDYPQTIIRSWNNPISYFDDMDCDIHITVPGKYRIYLEIYMLDLASSAEIITDNCTNYLEVHLGETKTRLCTDMNFVDGHLSYLSEGNTMTLHFHSDSNVGGKGFQARYLQVGGDRAEITTVLHANDNQLGVLRSVNHKLGFVDDVKETIIIQAPLGRVISLQLLTADVINTGACNDTYMEVIDNVVANHHFNVRIPLCSSSSPANDSMIVPEAPVQSHIHRVSIRFRTGNIGTAVNPGFTVRYNVLPDADFLNKTSTVTGVSFAECADKPFSCYNQGSCVTALDGGFLCKCPGYYTGLLCQVTWCEVNRCVRGSCNLTATYYKCLCDSGYYGSLCEMDGDTCRAKRCGGHGECFRENTDSVICECDLDYSGSHCETKSGRPMITPRTAAQRLLEEPIWIGLIVILSLVLIFIIMFCIKRKCSKRLERCCCQDKKKSMLQVPTGHLDHGLPSPSLPSYNSYVSREPSPTNFRRQPEIHIEEITEDNLATPVINEDNQVAAAKFFASYNSPFIGDRSTNRRHSMHTGIADRVPHEELVEGSIIGGSLVLSADQINTESSDDNPLAVLQLKPSDCKERRMTRSYSSTPQLQPHMEEDFHRTKSFDGLAGMHCYPNIIVSNANLGPKPEETVDHEDIIVVEEKPQRDSRFNREMYSLGIPSGPHSLGGDYFLEHDAKKRRREFAMRSHSAATMYRSPMGDTSPKHMEVPSDTKQKHWSLRSSSTESDIYAISRMSRRGELRTGSWEERTYSDSGLGHQSSCDSCYSYARRRGTCQCRKCIKYDRRNHHSHRSHNLHRHHRRNRSSGNSSDIPPYHKPLANTSSTESERRHSKRVTPNDLNDNRSPSRRTFRRHKTVDKCDSSNSEKDFQMSVRPPLKKTKSQDNDLFHAAEKQMFNKFRFELNGKSDDVILVVPMECEVDRPVSLLSISSNQLAGEDSQLDIAVISNNYGINQKDSLDAPLVDGRRLSSSEEDYSGEDVSMPNLSQYLSVTDTDSAFSSASKSFQSSPLRHHNSLSHNIRTTPEKGSGTPSTTFKARKSYVNDSAYQTKENSTDKSNSKATSSAPSPELGYGLDRYDKSFSSWSTVKSDDRRVTSQLQMAALKLAQLQRRVAESRSSKDGHLRVPSHDSSSQDDDLKGCLPLRTSTHEPSRRRTGKLRRLQSLNRESSLQEVTEENSPVVPEDAYQSAPESLVPDVLQKSSCEFAINVIENIEMQELA